MKECDILVGWKHTPTPPTYFSWGSGLPNPHLSTPLVSRLPSDVPNNGIWCEVLRTGCPSWHQPSETR